MIKISFELNGRKITRKVDSASDLKNYISYIKQRPDRSKIEVEINDIKIEDTASLKEMAALLNVRNKVSKGNKIIERINAKNFELDFTPQQIIQMIKDFDVFFKLLQAGAIDTAKSIAENVDINNYSYIDQSYKDFVVGLFSDK